MNNSGRLVAASASLFSKKLSNLSLLPAAAVVTTSSSSSSSSSSLAAPNRNKSVSARPLVVVVVNGGRRAYYSAVAASRYNNNHNNNSRNSSRNNNRHHDIIRRTVTTATTGGYTNIITRSFSSTGGGGSGGGSIGKKGPPTRTPFNWTGANYDDDADGEDEIIIAKDEPKDDDDFFGMHFDDGHDLGKLGPQDALPPLYKRDAATGRFTGDTHMELSDEQRHILQSDDYQRSKLLMQRLEEHWKRANNTKDDKKTTSPDGANKQDSSELNALGRRIRETNLQLNVLGRSVEAQAATARSEDGRETGRDDDNNNNNTAANTGTGGAGVGFTQRLTQQEFESFRAYMKKRYKVDVSDDEMPVLESSSNNNIGSFFSSSSSSKTDSSLSNDEARLATKWMTAQAQRQVDENLDDNPYADLMPADMSPSRFVNRKKAKSIPVPLLHHNNIPLLQSFLSKTAQIRSRIQTRLGARDQRRVSRLVKRARALGLIPYQGQFRSEAHGWMHAKDIEKPRPWEMELERRGLVIQKQDDVDDENDDGHGNKEQQHDHHDLEHAR